jgi:hypothetical protein
MDYKILARTLIEQLKHDFPLPWKVGHDGWAYTLNDRNGSTAMKCMMRDDAELIGRLASGHLTDPPVKSWHYVCEVLFSHLLLEHPLPWGLMASSGQWMVVSADGKVIALPQDLPVSEAVVEAAIQHQVSMVAFAAEMELQTPSKEFERWLQDLHN